MVRLCTLIDLAWLGSNVLPLSSVLIFPSPISLGFAFADPTPALLQETFSKHRDFAKSIMNVLPPDEVPIDLMDAHMIFKACELFDGFYYQLGEEDLRDAMGVVLGQAEVMDEYSRKTALEIPFVV